MSQVGERRISKWNVTTPEGMKSRIEEHVGSMIREFETKFRNELKDHDYYHVVITGEYPREACDQVQSIYKEAGWARTLCKTSSENGERPGLTGLQLWRKEPIS
jgi:hypothetical protein